MDNHRLSGDCDVAENGLNGRPGCVRALVGKTAEATSALSLETSDRDSNELKYLLDALCMIDSLLCREARDDFEFVTVENTLSSTAKKGMLVNIVEAVKMVGKVKVNTEGLRSFREWLCSFF